MNSSSSIGGAGNSIPPIPLIEEGLRSSQTQSKSQTGSDSMYQDQNSQLQTVKDLKMAELRGTPIHVGTEQIIKAIEKANKAQLGATTSFEFSIHQLTHEIMVKVIDRETGETLRELPPEKTLDMVAKMWEMAGIIVDKKV